MRFCLDHDVDAGVATVLRGKNHDCVLASEVGVVEDDDIAVWADDRDMVVVAHDNDFARRQMRRTIGRHLWLRFAHPDACYLVELHHDQIVAQLGNAENCVVEVRQALVIYHAPNWK